MDKLVQNDFVFEKDKIKQNIEEKNKKDVEKLENLSIYV